ncbi:hypothetical protein T08_11419 [Trichinella sp. T8]|nr:hypothetical protein T08_11419 [Trichinella sp. T8]
MLHFKNEFKYYCSGRNNSDPVGVTRPRGGTRKSRVDKNNTRAPPARDRYLSIWRLRVGVRKASCCAPIYRRSRDNCERAIKAAAVRPKGMEVVITTGSLKD